MTAQHNWNEESAVGQWRLAEVQLANWGTFDGLHRMPMARKGQLITGPSGSGKSSLLDGIAAVLTPDKWLRFNLAAQGAGSRADQRSLVSYVRGAWTRTTDEFEDRVISTYLRPRPTWSGILLRYSDGAGNAVSACRLFFARGTGTTRADLSDACVITRSAVDLSAFGEFVGNGIDVRRLQSAWPDAVVTSNGKHTAFYARLRSLLKFGSDAALHLLHKTQSAKNLDSLDQLFRDFMLDEPKTFALAKNAVEQFDELRRAHDHVVELRKQAEHLTGLAAAAERFERADRRATDAARLAAMLGAWQSREALRLARLDHEVAEEAVARLAGQALAAAAESEAAASILRAAQQRESGLGAGDVIQLRARIDEAESTASGVGRRWRQLAEQLAEVGVEGAPQAADEYEQLRLAARHEVDESPTTGHDDDLHPAYFQSKRNLAELDAQIDHLRRGGSNVPLGLQQLRGRIAAAIGIPEKALPFAAELIDVQAEFTEWAGAIERVVRPLALTMLVRDDDLAAVLSHTEKTHLNGRLVFEAVPGRAPSPSPAASSRSLVNRLTVAESDFGAWVSHRLSESFDYACVESADELARERRAVTINGQVKSGDRRYEKDDRSRVDDRSEWVLGDNDAKLEGLLARRQAVAAEFDEWTRRMDAFEKRRTATQRRQAVLGAVLRQDWADFDRAAATRTVAALNAELDELTRDNSELKAATERVRDAECEFRRLADNAADVEQRRRGAATTLAVLGTEIERLQAEVADSQAPSDGDSTELAERYRRVQRSLTRESIATVGQKVLTELFGQERAAKSDAGLARSEFVEGATQFKTRWPAASADLSADVDDRRGYLAVLENIRAHRLPEHVEDFKRLLRDKSRELIGHLRSEILDAPAAVVERVEPVNASLLRSPFDVGRFLQIEPKVRRGPMVRQFMEDLKTIVDGSWGDESLEAAEERFGTLAELMTRFASSEGADRVWREQCLDTRRHMTFLAHEVDENGFRHASYDSGAAMSGGQQQKLVVFCLAAALRYQLADADDAHPAYGTVVLDEAFDKADAQYTRMALDVFVEFGFHLVLATPNKLLQTIEPYVGAVTAVSNPTRQASHASTAVFEELE